MGKFNVKEFVADKIIERIENEKSLPWIKPWVYNGVALKRTGEPYSFLNQLLLPAGEYLSYSQIQKEGGEVKKGAKQYIVAFWKRWVPAEEEKAAKEEERNAKAIPLLRYFKVYNVKDTTLEAKHYKEECFDTVENQKSASEVFDEYCKKHNVSFEEEYSGRAFYNVEKDIIHMPLMKQFENTNGYYGTLFHEAVHSTGHKSRLNRLNGKKYNNTDDYSREELVAEIGACAILGHLGMMDEVEERNSAGYVKSWLEFLKNDKSAIIEASGKAQKAFEMIVG